MTTARAVFLDRDGVINRAFVRHGRPYPPQTLDELEVLPGVPEACAALKGAGFLLIVVTNQPDVARGTLEPRTLDRFHEVLRATLPLDDIRVCPHDDRDGCRCRKPAPGLLLAAAAESDIDLGRSVLVGDRWRDVEAGRRAGCKTVYVDYRYSESLPNEPDLRVGSLAEAVPWILKDGNGPEEPERSGTGGGPSHGSH